MVTRSHPMPGSRARRLAWIAGSLLVLVGLGLGVAAATHRHQAEIVLREWYYFYHNLRHPPKDVETLGHGKARTEILLADPAGLASDGAGNIYLADRGRSGAGGVIWRLDTAGQAWIIAGTGRRGSARAGIPAAESDLGAPQGLCLDGEGRLYFADPFNHKVLRRERDGRLTRIAGTGIPGYDGDGLPGKESRLSDPYDVACGPSGVIYIADFGNHRVRSVTPDGIMDTVAGTGVAGYAGDDGPATAARLNGPYGVLWDGSGLLYIADSLNHVVRVVAPDRRIRTIAGSHVQGYGGDGGPAREAKLDTPQSLRTDESGRLLISDEHNDAIRLVRLDGTIVTLFDTGAPGQTAPAMLADFEDFLIRPDGRLIIAEGENRWLIVLGIDGRVSRFAGVGVDPKMRTPETHPPAKDSAN